MLRKSLVEALGAFWLTFCGCGAAVLSAKFVGVGVGILGVSVAFGLSIVTFAYAFGDVSGAHMNPAVSFAKFCAKKMKFEELLWYVVGQVVGAIIASLLLLFMVQGWSIGEFAQSGFATNGFGSGSPGGYPLQVVFVTEVVMTFMFTFFILGVTSKKSLAPLAPAAIGLTLTLIHIVSIPISNTSVNPARSTGPALVYQGLALKQLWVFWLAPLIGAGIAGLFFRKFFNKYSD